MLSATPSLSYFFNPPGKWESLLPALYPGTEKVGCQFLYKAAAYSLYFGSKRKFKYLAQPKSKKVHFSQNVPLILLLPITLGEIEKDICRKCLLVTQLFVGNFYWKTSSSLMGFKLISGHGGGRGGRGATPPILGGPDPNWNRLETHQRTGGFPKENSYI